MLNKLLPTIRKFSPKLCERIELRDRRLRCESMAYRAAYLVAQTGGPRAIADHYGMPAWRTLTDLAERVAEDFGSTKSKACAKQGTLDGLTIWNKQHHR